MKLMSSDRKSLAEIQLKNLTNNFRCRCSKYNKCNKCNNNNNFMMILSEWISFQIVIIRKIFLWVVGLLEILLEVQLREGVHWCHHLEWLRCLRWGDNLHYYKILINHLSLVNNSNLWCMEEVDRLLVCIHQIWHKINPQ